MLGGENSMSDSMFVAASGALTQQLRLEVLSNNLANLNTVGFKEDKASFEAHLPEMTDPSDATQGGVPEVLATTVLQPYLSNNFHVTFEGSSINFSPGELKHTGNALDLALGGNGFFCIDTADGTRYTRKGNFTLNPDGELATADGKRVMGERGAIKIDGKEVVVDDKGSVVVDGTVVGTIKIVDFPQPYQLVKIGGSLFGFREDGGATEEKAEGTELLQGVLELSNVNAVRTMTEMIEVLRTYEAYQKVIQSMSETTTQAINEVGTLG
jgi:flagellar basal-body rod protein FlgG